MVKSLKATSTRLLAQDHAPYRVGGRLRRAENVARPFEQESTYLGRLHRAGAAFEELRSQRLLELRARCEVTAGWATRSHSAALL